MVKSFKSMTKEELYEQLGEYSERKILIAMVEVISKKELIKINKRLKEVK